MEKEILDKLVQAMDKIVLQFQEDNEIIFKDEKERKKIKYALINELKNWERGGICIYGGCSEPSILRSHTIQKSASLKSISEAGHTLSPLFHPDKEELCLELIGDNDASTFPGFCDKHEKLFKDFESKKELTEPEHFKLQLYRTVCREIIKKEAIVKHLEKRLNQYLEHREKRLGELIQNEVGYNFLKENNIQFQSSRFKIPDLRKKMIDEELKKAKNDLNKFLSSFKRKIIKDIRQQKDYRIYGKVWRLDFQVPVALAGRGNFHLMKDHKTQNVDVIINVLPFDSYTYVITSGLAINKEDIDYYLSHFGNPLHAINMIEAWMVHGSDHWFIKPSIWNKIKLSHQQKIFKDMFDKSRNIGQPYELSIFNDARRAVIESLKTNFDKLSDSQKEVIKAEESKLTDI